MNPVLRGGYLTAMSLTDFHPVVRRWFAERFGAPTPAQARGWDAIRRGGDALIAAPTGSGKTLAAFLTAIDDLLREGLESGGLPDETRVVYVSPLKALSADIHRNLAEPRREIRALAREAGLPDVRISAAVRSGDTTQAERATMLRTPPHILVTTPESLYLLLTAARGREMLRTARTVIVDEIHAVIESRRGAHLALSLERLDHVAERRLQRIGLSATQRPIERVADFLAGTSAASPCSIIDEGHVRDLDISLELPDSALEAVMSAEVWDEVYDRLSALVRRHRTTLVFVNTRRLAERVSRHLGERLGAEAVAAHHGSLSKEVRLDAEDRLKAGRLRALVATASLELGIDIGHVDLVCQLGSPRRVATFLQRVGRSGHTVAGTPKGRLFPLSRDDLLESAALLRLVERSELDRIVAPEAPLDVLSQQIVAETAACDWAEDDLYALVRRAAPYRQLGRERFEEVLDMLASGYTTRRGRRAALLHRDSVTRRLRGRRSARLLALTSGGAIPDNADYRVVVEPEGTVVGTVNEDFAVESMAGDIFQLGNTSWRVLRIQQGVVRVADAEGAPPNIPFWLGEAPSRSDELSAAVSELRADVDAWLGEAGEDADAVGVVAVRIAAEIGVPPAAAEQIAAYLAETKRLLGVVPTQRSLVLERFFDEAGGMQLVLHAPFGARVNRAWGLALRKKFCRTFNFELQAAATEEGVLLSLGPQHSFPLQDVFRYLHPRSVEDVLVQAVLDSPLFQTRWRWNTTISLAVPRQRGGRRVPPQIQRMQAEDLLAAAFPDAAACLENIAGDRQVPDHPLVRQTLRDCLHEAMDLDRLVEVLEAIRAGGVECIARDVPEPSPVSSQILNARVYEFLDDAPLEERRTQAVYTRRSLEPSSARDLGALDPSAIERVRAEADLDARDPDELHDYLMMAGVLSVADADRAGPDMLDPLVLAKRAAMARVGDVRLLCATERLLEVLAVHPDAMVEPAGTLDVARGLSDLPERDVAVRELVRGRMEVAGPVTSEGVADFLRVPGQDVEAALLALEAEGVVLRGAFTPGADVGEWCDRRLLARIHRYTLDRLRAEIRPVQSADFMRFLFRWQRIQPGSRVAGPEGLAGVIEQLAGFEVAAGAWETDVLAARVDDYAPASLDALTFGGRVAWLRLRAPTADSDGRVRGPLRSTPLALLPRGAAEPWRAGGPATPADAPTLSDDAQRVLEALSGRGASFFAELVDASRLLPTRVETALAELVAAGLATSDGFAGVRALLTPSRKRPRLGASPRIPGSGAAGAAPPGRRRRRRADTTPYSVETAGRWSRIGVAAMDGGAVRSTPPREAVLRAERAEAQARALLRRWGVVCRRVVTRESATLPWRELVQALRRLEARGEIRGGRFVAGFSGEQFALPEAVGLLRSIRDEPADGLLVGISAADPLNLTGIITPGDRVPALATNRVVYRDGIPVAALVAGKLRRLQPRDVPEPRTLAPALTRRVPPALRPYAGRAKRRPRWLVESADPIPGAPAS